VVAQRVRVRMKDLAFGRIFIESAQMPFRFVDGELLGVMYGLKTVRTQAQLDETFRAGHLTGTPADYVLNEDGYYVRNADRGTPLESPVTYYPCATAAPSPCPNNNPFVKIGDANPDFDMGFNTTLRWKTFSAYATVSAVRGGDIYNGARQLRFFFD